VGAGIAIVLGIVGSLVILKIVEAFNLLRVTKDEELEGLDLSMHNEEGYNFEA
jgi:Amt family ammonium transporter